MPLKVEFLGKRIHAFKTLSTCQMILKIDFAYLHSQSTLNKNVFVPTP